ncbi:hypothetical protein Scep_000486 [Stephania cephalantha]|uniref:Uncharacterized protein n=1 Tax=Stephania cephalantha TaxID=152367 RepID=A0AAP0Q2Z6_9MAGN
MLYVWIDDTKARDIEINNRRGTESSGAGPTAAARVRPAADHGACSGGKGSNQRRRGFDQQRLRGVQPAAATACLGGGSGLARNDGAATAHEQRRCIGGAAGLRRWSRRVSGGGRGGSPAVVAGWQ